VTRAQPVKNPVVLAASTYDPPLMATVRARTKPLRAAVIDETALPAGWKRDIWLESCRLCPCIRPGLVLGEDGGYLVVRDCALGDRHLLNRSAAAVFLLLNGARTLASVARELSAAFSIGKKQIESDIQRVICEMIAKKLLVLRTHPTLV
jgi:hypothetical protein